MNNIINRAALLQQPNQQIDRIASAASGVEAIAAVLREDHQQQQTNERLQQSLLALADSIHSNLNQITDVLHGLTEDHTPTADKTPASIAN